MQTPVEVRAKADAFVCDLAQLSQTVNLKAAGVSKQGLRPTHEAVQAAHATDGFVAGAQVEVIRVTENDLRAEVFDDVLRDCLDGARSAHGHKDGRLDRLMGQQ